MCLVVSLVSLILALLVRMAVAHFSFHYWVLTKPRWHWESRPHCPCWMEAGLSSGKDRATDATHCVSGPVCAPIPNLGRINCFLCLGSLIYHSGKYVTLEPVPYCY